MSLLQQAKDYRDGKTNLSHVRKNKRARIIRMAEKLPPELHALGGVDNFPDGYSVPEEVQVAIAALELIEDGEDDVIVEEECREDSTDTELD